MHLFICQMLTTESTRRHLLLVEPSGGLLRVGKSERAGAKGGKVVSGGGRGACLRKAGRKEENGGGEG